MSALSASRKYHAMAVIFALGVILIMASTAPLSAAEPPKKSNGAPPAVSSTTSATSGVSATSAAAAADSIAQQVNALIQAVRGMRVGLLTNPTGVDGRMAQIADVLAADPNTTVTAFFAPEHGVRGDRQAGGNVEDYTDPITGIPVYSIYGSRRAPTDEQLKTVDVLIFDIQDVGVRFYTYVWSMTYAMEEAAKNKVKFIVFDRPNPIGGLRVEGAPLPFDAGLVGRVWPGQPFGVATRHGMTPGELARLVNEEWMNPKVDLQVITMPGWTRDQYFTDTGRFWVLPSPNMPTPDTALVYPGTCLFEGTNLSEGRGTTRPFEIIGAPFINGVELAREMNALNLPGVIFRSAYFTPTFSKFTNEQCGGVQLHVTDRTAFDPIRTALYLAKTIAARYPNDMQFRSYASTLMGVSNIDQRLKSSESVDSIIASWQANLDSFKAMRQKYLLYPPAAAVEGRTLKVH